MSQIFATLFDGLISLIASFLILVGVVKVVPLLEVSPPAEHATEIQKPKAEVRLPQSPKSDLKPPKPKPEVKPLTPTEVRPLLPATSAPPTPRISITELNPKVRAAMVNILCTTQSGGSFKPISGSGVIIDPRGVILTNAHVAQYLFLKDYIVANFVECLVRTGDPAHPIAHAKILYFPRSWLAVNAPQIREQDARGTGKDDYALLLIDEPVPTVSLPETYSFVPANIDYEDIPIDNQVLLAAYPAELLGGIQTQKELGLVSTISSIQKIYFFDDTASSSVDIFSVGNPIIAQAGSSGGAVVETASGTLVGIIVTSTSAKTTGEKDLRAISLAHINRSLIANSGGSLENLLDGNVSAIASKWNATEFPVLRKALLDQLKP